MRKRMSDDEIKIRVGENHAFRNDAMNHFGIKPADFLFFDYFAGHTGLAIDIRYDAATRKRCWMVAAARYMGADETPYKVN